MQETRIRQSPSAPPITLALRTVQQGGIRDDRWGAAVRWKHVAGMGLFLRGAVHPLHGLSLFQETP